MGEVEKLREELAAMTAERDALVKTREVQQRNARDTFDAMCAMRDAINEHVPMPSLESDLLQGPENSVFCATVAEAVVAALIERDALVGAAYVAAAKVYENGGGGDSWDYFQDAYDAILALTPADATTALDHIRAQAKAEEMRKAAKEAGRYLSVADAQEAAAQKEVGK